MKKKKKLKIAMVLEWFPTASETFIVNQITGMMDAGHDVDIYAFDNPEKDERIHEKIRQYGLMERVQYLKPPPRGRMKRLGLTFAVVLTQIFRRPVYVLRCLDIRKRKVFEAVNLLLRSSPFIRKDYDIIQCQYGLIAQRMIFLKHVVRAGFFLSLRGHDVSIPDYNGTLAKDYQEVFRHADGLLPVCDYFAEKLARAGCPRKKIQTLYSGIDVSLYPFRRRVLPHDGQIVLLSVCRLAEMKGLDYVILALARIKKDGMNVRYVIVGDGPQGEALRILVKSLNLEDRVEFAGRIIDKDVLPFFERAHIFILPSVRDRTGQQEGIPNALKEAMAAGLPVVSTYHSGIPELVKDGKNGFLVPEKDEEALAGKLRFIIENPQILPMITKQAKKTVREKFDATSINRQLEAVYERVLFVS